MKDPIDNARSPRVLEATAVLLFLVQALRVLFSVMFGLIYDAVIDEELAVSVLGAILLCVVLVLLAPLAAPRRKGRAALLATTLVAALTRVVLTLNHPTARLWSSIVLIAAAGTYATVLVRRRPRAFPVALLLAFAVDQFLRVLGNTYDVSLRRWWLPVQAVLSVGLGLVAWLAFARSPRQERPAEVGIGLLGGQSVGALLFLHSSLLGFPNALARWTGVDYALVAPLLIAVTLVAALTSAQWGGLLFVALTAVGLAAGWMVGGAIGLVGLLVTQFLLLRIPFNLVRPRRRDRAGLALALGMLLFLVLNLALAFAFTYPYLAPAFRDKGPYVFLAGVLLAALSNLVPTAPGRESRCSGWWVLGAAMSVLLTMLFSLPPRLDLKESSPVHAATYNIHYGYDTSWRLSLEEQACTIEESGADIVFLQEVDTCRITSYGVDNALWLARRLGMQVVYAPALERLSGIAVLSRFPILEQNVHLLASRLEQTAIAHARVAVDGQPLDVYGIWLGLEPEERALQLDDALPIIGDASPAVFGGDLNATPDAPVYARIEAAGFEDAFVAAGLEPVFTDPAVAPFRRIDYVWVRGLEVHDAQVLDSLASDHRCVVATLARP